MRRRIRDLERTATQAELDGDWAVARDAWMEVSLVRGQRAKYAAIVSCALAVVSIGLSVLG